MTNRYLLTKQSDIDLKDALSKSLKGFSSVLFNWCDMSDTSWMLTATENKNNVGAARSLSEVEQIVFQYSCAVVRRGH